MHNRYLILAVRPELVEGRRFPAVRPELVEGRAVRGFDRLTTNG